MTINTFTVHAKLPSLNDVINVNRNNRYQGNNFKKEIEEVIGWDIKRALAAGTLKPVEKPCVIYIEFHESSKRRDVDNIQSSQKFLLDSMVRNGVLKNDSRRYVKQTYPVVVDDSEDFVVVKIEEVK